eukprot:3306177-Rhodomonas_salina.1
MRTSWEEETDYYSFGRQVGRRILFILLVCSLLLEIGCIKQAAGNHDRESSVAATFKTKLRVVSNDQWCGDGICDVLDETQAWCPQDCSCGDGFCDVRPSAALACRCSLSIPAAPSEHFDRH